MAPATLGRHLPAHTGFRLMARTGAKMGNGRDRRKRGWRVDGFRRR